MHRSGGQASFLPSAKGRQGQASATVLFLIPAGNCPSTSRCLLQEGLIQPAWSLFWSPGQKDTRRTRSVSSGQSGGLGGDYINHPLKILDVHNTCSLAGSAPIFGALCLGISTANRHFSVVSMCYAN